MANKELKLKKSVKLLTDNPIECNKDESLYYSLDGLKFNEYTEVLKQAIIDTQTPFTVGVFDKWGKGKTSFLKMLQHKITKENKNKYFTVWFNAWKYEKEQDPIIALLMSINETLEANKTILEKLNEGLAEIGENIENASIYIKHTILELLNYKTKVNILGQEFSNSFSASKVYKNSNNEIEKLKSKDELDELINQSSYIKIFDNLKKFQEILVKKDVHMIIFIDDLDRCMPDNAVSLLENIKLVLDLKNVTYILAVANEVIEGHLEHKYEKDFGLDKKYEHGKSYLEKIVQLPFYLPDFSLKLDNLVDGLFKKIDNSEYLDNVKEVINSISTHNKLTPRLLVRHLNQAKVHAQIDELFAKGNIECDNTNNNIEKHSDFMFSIFTFVLFLKALYESEYNILIEYSPDTLKDLDNKSEVIKKKKDEDKEFKSLLESNIAKKWIKDKTLREKTIEFMDTILGTREEDIKDRLDKQSVDEIRNEILNLEEEIKTEDDFKRLIYDGEDLYKAFVNIEDEKGNKFQWSKYLVTNIWYKEFKSNHNSGDKFNYDFQPVVNISYKEAEDFCEYLNKDNQKYKYALPSKKQFEYVASGSGENRKYPWGDKYNNKFCNNFDIGLKKTSIVGAFKIGDSKDGICDMSGNVWKWTSSDYSKNTKVIKGGSWDYFHEVDFASSYNFYYASYGCNSSIGFFLTRTKK